MIWYNFLLRNMKELIPPNLDYNLPFREREREYSSAQHLQFKLIELGSFHNLDGDQVVKGLQDNPGIWRAAMLTNFGEIGQLIALRDMDKGSFNADTLLILSEPGNAADVTNMVRDWSADEVDWLEHEEVQEQLGVSPARDLAVLRLWWG